MEKCTGKITDWLIECDAIPETDRKLYEYAIYSILLSLSPRDRFKFCVNVKN